MKIGFSYWARLVAGVIGLFLVVPLVTRALGGDFTLGVYIGTGIAVLWYTIETYYLRREVVRQNESTIHPLVIASVEFNTDARRGKMGTRLVASNVGNGVAIFVHIPDIVLIDPAGDRVRFTARFAGLSHLEKGEERLITVAECVPSAPGVNPAHLDAATSLDEQVAVESYTMRIEYQDIRGGKHWTEMQMGKGGSALLRYF